jgi:transposase-like protein
MDKATKTPKTLTEAIRYYADPDVTLVLMVQVRWPKGVTCPMCGSTDVHFISTRRLWECRTKHPLRQFSVKVGTIFEDSPIGLDKWFVAIWLLNNCKNGVSSLELHRAIGVTQKSAWFMLHRIRAALHRGTLLKMGTGGPVEADETFIGGLARNMHAWKRAKKITGTGGEGKELVMACSIASPARCTCAISQTARRRRSRAKSTSTLRKALKSSPTNWRATPDWARNTCTSS